MDPVEISAGRLHLRPWREEDVAEVLRVCSDPVVQRWTSVPAPYTPEHARDYVAGRLRGWQTGRDLGLAVCDSTTGRLLASVALRAGAADGRWEVGCWAAPEARGRAVVPQAVGALCRWALAQPELRVARLEWLAETTDYASRRAAEKAGFTAEGVLRAGLAHRGEHRDAWIAARLPADPDGDTAALPPLGRPGDGVVALRRWSARDVDVVRRACDDPLTARWLPVETPYTEAAARRWLLEEVPGEWADGRVANVAVVDDSSGDVLGSAGLGLVQRGAGIGEVGYWTAPWARGRGVAGRAAALLADWGLDALGLARVELLAALDNAASQRAAERGGFVREGVARAARRDRSGGRQDLVLFSRTAADRPPA